MNVLTDTYLRSLKPKPRRYKSRRERGLHLRIDPNGSRLWYLAYTFMGKEDTLSLGPYPAVSLGEARSLRDAARKLIAHGISPKQERREARAAAEAATEHSFASVVARWKADELAANSDEYQRTVARMLERDVLPYLGERPIADIKTRELIAVFDRIRQRGVEETARRARTIVGQIFRYAIRRGIVENDPTYALRGERRIKPVRHFAAFTDPDAVTRLMRAIYGYKGTPEVRAALKLSAMLFQRPGEIRRMQWQQLDLDAAQWRYVVSKTKRTNGQSHIVPLPTQAVAILRDLESLMGGGIGYKPDAPRHVMPTPKTKLRPAPFVAPRECRDVRKTPPACGVFC